jgi:hypothetical protein
VQDRQQKGRDSHGHNRQLPCKQPCVRNHVTARTHLPRSEVERTLCGERDDGAVMGLGGGGGGARDPDWGRNSERRRAVGVMLVGTGGACRPIGRIGVSDASPQGGRELSGLVVTAAETGRLVAWGISCEHRQGFSSVAKRLSASRSAAVD